ncbi:transient receptor potential cation channel subfamily V member 1 isoform X1 [Erpetoichthys calabaricus]|uniref:Transient receptor potential cation channel, subfamily V, member 1 n=1 Tax=Erpetoichthys calabaricus TaxID=27687 RepID=A0A8C4SQ39_ERPCA|nr:transient receptor potential cation channel subfamily V member 1 isoform X1 [Erpetoichthys calabaricus]XP_028662797.1 transient receptor potential cation channel subfamily V member 1 isoform X1 [Erpetoichthys calabaricus]
MDQPETTEQFSFTLETEDSPFDPQVTKSPRSKPRKKFASGFRSSDSKAPMDTCYQEEYEESAPMVKFNLDFDRKPGSSSSDSTGAAKFDLKTLFDAVASGDVSRLDGLQNYLRKTLKQLTHSDFKDPVNGKTCLLKALLNLKDGQNDTIDVLLDIAEKEGYLKDFVNAAYTDSYYKGQSALHVAIERRNRHYVEMLVQKGADVNARASGKFFQLNEGNGFYFGELPLALAACTNQMDIVKFLMENPYEKAKVDATDSMGNTVLHALVTVADNTLVNTKFVTMMYDEILRKGNQLYPKIKLESITNNRKLTPLKLAAKTGKLEIFKHIIGREFPEKDCRHLSRKFTEWVYGPVHSCLYDIDSIDSYEKNSVLEILVYGSEIPNRHELLCIEPLNKVLEDKWKKFVSKIFFTNFFFYLMYLITFTMIAYYRKEGKPSFHIENTPLEYLRLAGQLISLSGAVYFFIKGIKDLLKKRTTWQGLIIDGYYEILFFLQALFFLTATVLYFLRQEEYVACLVLSLALAWVDVLYYTRGFKHLGIYSVMIQKMILRDIMRFLIVYMVFLIGFSASLVTLIEDSPAKAFVGIGDGTCNNKSYNSIYFTTQELFKFTIGMGDLEFTEQFNFKHLFYFLLICYIILTYILLLNMLIALMSETVDKISKESKNIWKLQRAITIFDLEKSLPRYLKSKLRSGITKDLGSSANEDIRRCFRVETVNWNQWNSNLGIINEEPGNHDINRTGSPHIGYQRGQSWRNMMPLARELINRQPPPTNEEEMQTFNTTSI